MALLLFCIGLVTVGTPSDTEGASLQAFAPVEALLVGDSVMAGMAQSYGAPARDLLAARHSFILDAKGCRRLITTSCQIGSTPPPSTAITVVTAAAGRYSRVLVVAAGYNDSTTGTSGLGTAVDRLVAEAVRQGVPHVIWLTYREAGSLTSRYRAHNALLRQKLTQHPQLRLADWAARSATLPTSWFSADGIHLGADSAKSMADLIADTIDLLPPPPPPPCRVVTTTISYQPPAAPSSAMLSVADAAAVVGTAVRLHLWCPGERTLLHARPGQSTAAIASRTMSWNTVRGNSHFGLSTPTS